MNNFLCVPPPLSPGLCTLELGSPSVIDGFGTLCYEVDTISFSLFL